MQVERKLIYEKYPLTSRYGKLNFAGVLERNFIINDIKYEKNQVSYGLNSKTQATYLRDYNIRLLEQMDDVLEFDLEDCDFHHFQEVMKKVLIKYGYETSTRDHYRRLIMKVCNSALATGMITRNVFWGTDWRFSKDEKQQPQKSTPLNSLTQVQEQALLMLLLFDVIHAPGEIIGLLLMHIFGLRNHEAAALTYEDMVSINTEELFGSLRVKQSATDKRNVIQASGKTENAVRRLPFIHVLKEVMIKRLDYIVSQIDMDPKKFGVNEDYDKMQLPICCFGHRYTDFAMTRDITEAGKYYLRLINFNEEQFARIQQGLVSGDIDDGDDNGDTEDGRATSYLLRHNAATRWYVTGLKDPEIQYIIGHMLEDPIVQRKDYGNTDFQLELCRKMKRHPFNSLLELLCHNNLHVHNELDKTESAESYDVNFVSRMEDPVPFSNESTQEQQTNDEKIESCIESVDIPDSIVDAVIVGDDGYASVLNSPSAVFQVKASDTGSTIRLRADLLEPGDTISIKAKGTKVPTNALVFRSNRGYSSEVNILADLTRRYHRAETAARRMVSRIFEERKLQEKWKD